jgi:uncharacterized protein YjeT (DUF2065 family)
VTAISWSGTGAYSTAVSSHNTMDYFLCVIGMVMIIEGVPYFASPATMKRWVRQILELPDGLLRRFGLALMASGLLLVYLGRT